MGIKFLCPNGHKLHVKSFLSGKKAICPKCGARMIVPAENSQGGTEETATSSSWAALGRSSEIALEESLVDDAMETMSPTDAAAGLETQQATPPLAAGSADPIAEAPSAVWYVRPATGGQYGPASAEIMRGWLADGRVGPNSLVWRAPWSEWRSAASTFPEMTPSGASGPIDPAASNQGNGIPPLPVGHAVESVAPGPQVIEAPPSMPPLAQVARKRRRKNDVRLIASAILGTITVILVIVLLLVFRWQGGREDPKTEESPPADEQSLI